MTNLEDRDKECWNCFKPLNEWGDRDFKTDCNYEIQLLDKLFNSTMPLESTQSPVQSFQE